MCIFSMNGLAQSEALQLSYMNDGLEWSSNDYYGTARTMGMGNAVTSVGGDLGTIAINPAGGAVASYSQVAVSPGLSMSFVGAKGVSSYDGNTYLGNNAHSNAAKFVLPSAGINFNFNTGNSSGLVNFSIGFVANCSQKYNCSVKTRGITDFGGSTYSGYLAAVATDQIDYYIKNEKWQDELTALAAKTNAFGYNTAVPGGFTGVSENGLTDGTASLGGPITQRYNRTKEGSKMDYILNVAFNISDIIYLGASLGMVGLNYRIGEMIGEEAIDPTNFQTGFENLTCNYSYRARGTGVYGKFGIIAAPFDGLRLGAAIQTPTRFNMVERYNYGMTTEFPGNTTTSGTSDEGSWSFTLSSPWRFNVGASYTFGNFAIVSADYERVNYKYTKYLPYYTDDFTFCDKLNERISGETAKGQCLGASNIVRAGVEIKPLKEFAVRAGYNLTTSAKRQYESYEQQTIGKNIHSASLGVGYISPGSFFCDIAARMNFYPAERRKVYDAQTDWYSNRADPESVDFRTVGNPVIEYTNNLLSVVATIGWRF